MIATRLVVMDSVLFEAVYVVLLLAFGVLTLFAICADDRGML